MNRTLAPLFLVLMLVASAAAQAPHAPSHDHDHDHGAETPAAAPEEPLRPMTPREHAAFAEAVDTAVLAELAVYHNGRAKILDTLAREQLEVIYGKPYWRDEQTGHRYDPVFAYLDLVMRPHHYFDKPLIYVEVVPLREELLDHLPREQRERWLSLGRLSPQLFNDPQVRRIVNGMDGDLRLQNARNQVRRSVLTAHRAVENLLLVSPPQGQDTWVHVLELGDTRLAAAGPPAVLPLAQMADPDAARGASEAFSELRHAWRAGDAAAVNLQISQLSELLPRINPHSYPTSLQRQLEHIYNATARFTVGWVAYFVAALLLLIAFATGRRLLARGGLAMLLLGLVVHTIAIAVRGYLSGRWPIHNQYESFIAVTWFAIIIGLAFMLFRRQWLFGAAASALGACALMLANVTAIPSEAVAQTPAVLSTSNILYVHVNIILVSYGLIALGFFISLVYLGAHYLGGGRVAAAGLGEFDVVSPGQQALLSDIDKAQMVVLQLAFWLLGVGVLLGAYWADHAWGRWWGWDPKETWALITWIVYLIAIHMRFTVKKRGLVTAWLSVVGFGVMLWTYWGVNLLLAGLHSYA